MTVPAGLYFSHPACLRHEPQLHMPGHPEQPERLVAIERAMLEQEPAGWERRSCPEAGPDQLELIHEPAHVARMRVLAERGGAAIDLDTYIGASSYEAALRGAGGAVEMAAALLRGEAPAAFCAVRPPGHHAEANRAMGFCLFNNVAIAAEAAIRELGVRRVLIIDWDVHHGNGSAESFRRRPDLLYASIHQIGIFPGTGSLQDSGSGAGEGYTINLPVPAGSAGQLWISLLTRAILPAARAFEPELILISAGYDAHLLDPLASCGLETESFARMAGIVRDLARELGVPVGAVLEGGYEPAALADSVIATLRALGGGRSEPAVVSGGAQETSSLGAELIEQALAQVRRHWPV